MDRNETLRVLRAFDQEGLEYVSIGKVAVFDTVDAEALRRQFDLKEE